MKIIAAIPILITTVNATASSTKMDEFPVHVNVTLEASVSGSLLLLAQGRASKLLAPAGVRLIWHNTPAPSAAGQTALAITFLADTPASLQPNRKALAVARPYAKGGQQILVFNDRVTTFIAPYGRRSWMVLGHILAHEIGHVLENIARHSDTGLMRATWTFDDLSFMVWTGLPFAPEDNQLIRKRMELLNRSAAAIVEDGPEISGR
jgi:hypothetical protein